MRKLSFLALAALVLPFASPAQAEEPMDHTKHQAHMAAMLGDTRQQVNFPPEMRQHNLANMRDHLAALSEILTAMGAAQYGKASQVASARLGMDSASAEACKGDSGGGTPQMSMPGSMEHQMSQFMPEGMRQMGLNMHQAASDFAKEAAKADKTRNARPALAALARVTQQCTACHATFKVQ